MAFPVLLDTCAIYGAGLTDLLLTLAERGTFRPLWSDDITAELGRNLGRAGIAEDPIKHRIDSMNSAFPDAVVTGHTGLIPQMACHEEDRHVLAAAVRGGAAIIVTFNLRHFPSHALEPYEIAAVHPDEFLLDQLDLYPDAVIEAVRDVPAVYENPPVTIREFLSLLTRSGVPRFATALTPRI